MTDDPKSGAQFAREAGADPHKWAEAYYAAVAAAIAAGELRSKEDEIALIASWFRDAQRAAVREATNG